MGMQTNSMVRLLLLLCLIVGWASALEAQENPQGESGGHATVNEFWGDIRKARSGTTSVAGAESGVAINASGEEWRMLRNGLASDFTQWIIGVVIVSIVLVYAIRGRIRIAAGRSGKRVERWSTVSRIVHWYVAILFLLLMLSGLTMLFGKAVLLPIMGKSLFAAWAQTMKMVHNYGGPLFLIGIVVMALIWIKDNIPTAVDLKWLLQGGGIFTKAHPSAGYMNGGEKIWFWIVVICGLTASVTGLIMDFPNFGQLRETMQSANIIHIISAGILMAIFFGHFYIATLGTEGAVEGMVSGSVDENWAKQHHDLWYEEISRRQ